jgi:hypothetical protein
MTVSTTSRATIIESYCDHSSLMERCPKQTWFPAIDGLLASSHSWDDSLHICLLMAHPWLVYCLPIGGYFMVVFSERNADYTEMTSAAGGGWKFGFGSRVHSDPVQMKFDRCLLLRPEYTGVQLNRIFKTGSRWSRRKFIVLDHHADPARSTLAGSDSAGFSSS